ncbi:MAG: hypothetical protein ABIT82_13540 [Ramlibacter sp.]
MADNAHEHDRTASLMTAAKLAQAGRSRAPLAPSVWLDRMAADAGHLHVQRLGELAGVLETHAGARQHGAVLTGMEQFQQALPKLQFDQLQTRGWWARTTGKGKSAGAQFAAVFDGLDPLATGLSAQVDGLTRSATAEAAATDRALVEFEVEYRALDKVVDQGARWLQDMQSQLKARHAAGADSAGQQQIRDDASRCEILVGRLKLLRDAIGHAQQVHQQALAAAGRRQVVLRQVQSCKLKEWRASLSALSITVADGSAAALQLDAAVTVHASLESGLKDAASGLQEVLVEELELARGLDVLKRELGASA